MSARTRASRHPDVARLLGSIRTLYDAAACSYAVVEAGGTRLRFVAADGAGADRLPDVPVSLDRGIIGWVARSGLPAGVAAVATDTRFDHAAAQATGYVPTTVLAAPVADATGAVVGVVEVLDPAAEHPGLEVLTVVAARLDAAVRPVARAPGSPHPVPAPARVRPAPDAASAVADDPPEWSAAFADPAPVRSLPLDDVREWAFGGATGAGIRVAVVDSGVDPDHPAVGGIAGGAAVVRDGGAAGGVRVEEGPHEDLVGHGTACAGVIRGFAPEAELLSVRVLGADLKGQGAMLVAGVEWALARGIDVVNLSLSSRSESMYARLHALADAAYFAGTTLVCAANNDPGPTYPSQFASVVSVAAAPGDDPWGLACNPRPPVELGARGIDVEVAWSDGETVVATGNSFAAPHVTGMVALMRSKHPWLTPYQVKTVLLALSDNARVR